MAMESGGNESCDSQAPKPSSVSSEVEFTVLLKDGSTSQGSVRVHIDSDDDDVTLDIPEDLKIGDQDAASITVRMCTKVKVLPDLLFTRFKSNNQFFYSVCSCFVNLCFVRSNDGLFKCSHCEYTVDVNESPSRDETTDLLLQHLAQHQDHLPCLRFSCKQCTPLTVMYVDELIRHFEKQHPELLSSEDNARRREQDKDDENEELVCPICSMVCFGNSAVVSHMHQYHSFTPDGLLPSTDEIQNGIEVSYQEKK